MTVEERRAQLARVDEAHKAALRDLMRVPVEKRNEAAPEYVAYQKAARALDELVCALTREGLLR